MNRRRCSTAAALAAFLLAVAPRPAGAVDCTRFLRGDSNLDGQVNLADAIRTLEFLFAAGEWLSCPDAADADDSGSIVITDPIFTLAFLFASGSPPPPPGPIACGLDETPDALECYATEACALDAVGSDFSGFARFAYDQRPAFGFCEVDRVFRATIELVGGQYRLEMSILVEGTPPPGECVPTTFDVCLVESPLPARTLTPEEAARVRQAFASIPVYPERDAICDCLGIDPCVIPHFAWDGAPAVSGYPCEAPHMSLEDTRQLQLLLESLRP
jgi:hypothetical protein